MSSKPLEKTNASQELNRNGKLTPRWSILQRRLGIAGSWYVFVILFVGAFALVRDVWDDLTVPEAMIIAAIIGAPIIIALIWDRIASFKFLELEFTFKAIDVTIDEELASAVQEQKGSGSREIVEQIVSSIEKEENELLLVNLRDGQYWWSTRLFLLAALAEDYTGIKRLVFVEDEADQFLIGMVEPAILRRLIASKFPAYENKYREIQGVPINPSTGKSIGSKVEQIAYRWPVIFYPQKEEEVREFVSKSLLKSWTEDSLEREFVEWDGGPETALLYYRILVCSSPYIALVRDRKLKKVVNRFGLGVRIGISVLKKQLS